jgi:hypothetical protein
VADDWRATIETGEELGGGRLLERLLGIRLAEDVRERLGGHIAVGHDDTHLFLYGEAEDEVRRAAEEVRPLLGLDAPAAVATVERWHPVEERWEDPSVAMPETPEDVAREEASRRAREEQASRLRGEPEWEVRIELADRHAAAALQERLADEGYGPVRRFRYLIVGADSHDAATELADRLRPELPAGAAVVVEGSASVAREQLRNPFAVFGGLGA